jgi:hypothetical protein
MSIFEMVEDILEHYGTKGMKWGVRKRNVPKQGPSDDAKKAHKAYVKATVSGPQALSNKELQMLKQRLSLEQEYAKLSYNPSKAKKILDSVLGTGKQVNEAVAFVNSPAGQALTKTIGAKKVAAAAKKTT